MHANAIVRSSVINTLDSYQATIGYFMNSFLEDGEYMMEKCIYIYIVKLIIEFEASYLLFFSKFVGKERSKNSFDSTIKIDSQLFL